MNIATLYNEPRVYAYTLPGIPKLDGWVKVGYTDRQTVAERIAQQLKTPLLDYRIEMYEPAYTKDGRFFRDSAIHKVLEEKGFQRARFKDVDADVKGKKGKKSEWFRSSLEDVKGKKGKMSEWFRCSLEDVKAVVRALQGQAELKDSHYATFGMRPEQARAVKMTADYFRANKRQKE